MKVRAVIFLILAGVSCCATGVLAQTLPAAAIGDAVRGSALSAAGTDSPLAFTAATERMILTYVGTAEPQLPEPDGDAWSTFDSPASAAPGRMRIPRNVVVDKPATRVYVITVFGDTIFRARVCASKLRGQKMKRDDWRTPEGNFAIMGIYNSKDWTYKDTGDKCYGPYFISLITPGFMDIGIHGTNVPSSVPGRRSHGCMRLHNEDVTLLRTLVNKDSRIIVMPDPEPDPYE